MSSDVPNVEHLFASVNEDALNKNSNSIATWSKYKDDCETTKSTLSWLPQKLTHKVMVQAGPKALFPGNLVHTNEYLVNIGETWFVKKTAHQASEICDRRIEKCNEMIQKFERERELIVQRLSLPSEQEAFGSDENPEIIEYVTEEEDQEWREQHRLKEKVYRKKLMELKLKNRQPLKSDEDLWNHLDELELQEELEDELNRLNADLYDDENSSDDTVSDDVDVRTAQSMAKNADIEEIASCEFVKARSSSVEEKQTIKFQSSDTGSTVSANRKPKQKVSFVHDSESSDDEPVRIQIKHSPISSKPSSEDDSCINSPADIYQVYLRSLSPKSQSQSILKNKVNPNMESELEALKRTNFDIYEADNTSISESSSFAGIELPDVVEKRDFTTEEEKSTIARPPKKMSKFRASRMN